MDIIDDILFALHSYTHNDHNDQGLAYLETFGVLQSLFVQQDAVSKLHKVITGHSSDLEKEYPDLKVVRDVRIRVAGHPVGGQGSSHFLVRYTVSKRGFELWKFDQAGNYTEQVNLPELIRKNCRSLQSAMANLISLIEAEKREHKEKFRKKSLADNFQHVTYFVGKMFEGISRKSPMGMVGLASIREVVSRFRSDLEARSEHFRGAHFISDHIPRLEYAFEKYEGYMQADEKQNEDDAYIFASFIENEMEYLENIAREIDADYQEDAEAEHS